MVAHDNLCQTVNIVTSFKRVSQDLHQFSGSVHNNTQRHRFNCVLGSIPRKAREASCPFVVVHWPFTGPLLVLLANTISQMETWPKIESLEYLSRMSHGSIYSRHIHNLWYSTGTLALHAHCLNIPIQWKPILHPGWLRGTVMRRWVILSWSY